MRSRYTRENQQLQDHVNRILREQLARKTVSRQRLLQDARNLQQFVIQWEETLTKKMDKSVSRIDMDVKHYNLEDLSKHSQLTKCDDYWLHGDTMDEAQIDMFFEKFQVEKRIAIDIEEGEYNSFFNHFSKIQNQIILKILAQCQIRQTLRIGLLFVENVTSMEVSIGYRTSASAVLITRDRIRSEHLLDNFDFEFIHKFDECDEVQGGGKTVDLIEHDNVDVIFGPTCNRPGVPAAALAGFYNVPIFVWGLTSSKVFTDHSRFPTIVPFSVNSYSLALAIREVMLQYGWEQFVFLYSNDGDTEKCESLKDDIQVVSSLYDDITLAYTAQSPTKSIADFRTAIRAIKQRGRIIVTCVASGNGSKKAVMQAATLEDANNVEYTYIIAETNSRGFYVDELGGKWHYLWEGTASENILDFEETQKSMENVLFLVDNMGMYGEVTPEYLSFSQSVIARMKEAPFNCTDDCAGENYSSVAKYAGQLADAFYVYAVALNRSLTANPQANPKNGSMILQNIGMTFQGVGGGDVILDSDASRRSAIYLMGLNYSLLPEYYAELIITNHSTEYNIFYSDESELWNGEARPKDKPACGFTGSECPANFFQTYLVYTIIAGLLIFATMVSAVGAMFYAVRTRQKDIERQDKLWHVDFRDLQTINNKSKFEASERSFASAGTKSTTTTRITIESRQETTRFAFYKYTGEMVAANKHDSRTLLDDEERMELRKMRGLDHDNLNKFIGLCLDAPQLLSVWKYCSRGSLADVISKSSMQMDNFFMFSLIRDISHGLAYIHNSFLNCHGYLTSRSCLIDDRWQVKISDFGIGKVRFGDKITKRGLFWTAPEILRNDMAERTKECDVYSFGIICSEVITKSSAFDFENRKEKEEEILYQLKKGGFNAIRPSLDFDGTLEINPALLHLIRDCWTEKPSERPTIEQVKSLLRSMNDGRKENLMDHVFNMLETYASNLEEEVEERMKELTNEKKKSDVLLYRMLPKMVADKLKLGQSVEPETFSQVTLFFSDVVQFTTLASKSTPFQVVQLLNDLYTNFDSIIEQNDVYKVETIGDGYLCVSGLPHRNGNEHIRHIARMSLGFLSSLQTFKVPHLPTERIQIRIGIHCGSVVAGVVGLTMPRYCLFGDAVNTASRMESNGKPGRIHVSAEANKMLTEVVGGFRTENRGEVIIKGKGVMETFWLLEEIDGPLVRPLLKKETRPVSPSSLARSITPSIN